MQSWDLLLGIGSLLVLVMAASFGCGEVLFAPLREAVRAPGCVRRFRMADLATLMVQLQLGAGGVLALLAGQSPTLQVVWIVSLWAVLVFWWTQGIALLEEAGVEHSLRRVWFLGVVAPLGYAAILTLIPLTPAFVTVAFIGLVVASTGDYGASQLSWSLLLLGSLLATMAALAGVVVGCRLACRNLVRPAPIPVRSR